MQIPVRWLLVCLVACSSALWAQAPARPDAKGCTESKVVTRMPGCFILRCDHKDFSTAEMPRTKSERGHQVEGEFEFTSYRCPSNKSPVELGRNTEAALKDAGFNILYTDVYIGGARFWMTAQKGGQWVKLAVVSDTYDLTTVKEKPMEQVMTANAEGWAQQINQSGRASVYGINFDTGKSTIRPDSEPALNEVARLLQGNPSWAMVVAGHTDNVGAKAANLALSRQRAQAVIAWLAAHGVEESRLVPAGFGDTRPVADNKDEAGRQKNRRVDLVKVY
jgi:outer membrane protein OmpA-like peptidoglycan-associated protein